MALSGNPAHVRSVTMTRKHYRQFATMLQQIQCLDTRANMAANMIPIFQADNPRFDDQVFLGAAGLLEKTNISLKESINV